MKSSNQPQGLEIDVDVDETPKKSKKNRSRNLDNTQLTAEPFNENIDFDENFNPDGPSSHPAADFSHHYDPDEDYRDLPEQEYK